MADDPTTTWRRHATSIVLLALTIIALYWRVFLFGETVIDVKTLDNQLPWGYSAPEESNHPYNRRDPTDMYLTREYFIVQSYRDGELPLWNPYTMAGHPIYADGVTRIFSPFLLFYGVFDPPLAYSLARLTELLLGAVFLYLYLIAIGVSARGALLGALAFELSAHSLFHLTGLGWWGGLMWLPLIFLWIDRALTRNDLSAAILAGVGLALQFYCGYMPNQIYYVTAIALYYVVFGSRMKGLSAPEVRHRLTTVRILVMLAVTIGVGLALAATQWVPVMELLEFSNRRVVPTEAGYIYLPPWYLVTLVFPNLFGTAYDPKLVTLFAGLNVSHDHSLYLSAAALLPLGYLTFLQIRKWQAARAAKSVKAVVDVGAAAGLVEEKRLAFFLFLLTFALVVMMAAPVYVYGTQFIPILRSIRVIVRAGVLFIFAVSVLIGFGTDALLAAGREELLRFRRLTERFLLLSVAIVAVAIGAFSLLRLSGVVTSTGVDYVAGSGKLAYLRSVTAAFANQFAPPKAHVLIALICLGVACLLLRLWQSGKITRYTFFWALVLFLVADLSINSLQYDGTHEARRVFPETQITERLRSLPTGRILVAPSGLESNRRERDNSIEKKIIAPPNTLLAYRLPTVTGKDQLFPKAYREFCSLIEPQPHLSHVVFNKMESPFFNLLNVRYILTHESVPAPADSEIVERAEGLALYENKRVQDRAFFAREVLAPGITQAEALERLRAPDFDGRKTAILDGVSLKIESPAPGTAAVVEDRRNRVVVETENAGEGLLVLSDNWYPGWQAEIDGGPAEILRANYTMRAVRVPAGRHVVSFRFAPRTFRVSLFVTLISLLGVLISFILLRKRTKSKSGVLSN